MALPKYVQVAEHENADGTKYLLAELRVEDAIEDDGPTVVGTYKLVSKKRMVKKVTEDR
jgi:hypothetical protein